MAQGKGHNKQNAQPAPKAPAWKPPQQNGPPSAPVAPAPAASPPPATTPSGVGDQLGSGLGGSPAPVAVPAPAPAAPPPPAAPALDFRVGGMNPATGQPFTQMDILAGWNEAAGRPYVVGEPGYRGPHADPRPPQPPTPTSGNNGPDQTDPTVGIEPWQAAGYPDPESWQKAGSPSVHKGGSSDPGVNRGVDPEEGMHTKPAARVANPMQESMQAYIADRQAAKEPPGTYSVGGLGNIAQPDWQRNPTNDGWIVPTQWGTTAQISDTAVLTEEWRRAHQHEMDPATGQWTPGASPGAAPNAPPPGVDFRAGGINPASGQPFTADEVARGWNQAAGRPYTADELAAGYNVAAGRPYAPGENPYIHTAPSQLPAAPPTPEQTSPDNATSPFLAPKPPTPSYQQWQKMSPFERTSFRTADELAEPWAQGVNTMRQKWGGEGVTRQPDVTPLEAGQLDQLGQLGVAQTAEIFGDSPQNYWQQQARRWQPAEASSVSQHARATR